MRLIEKRKKDSPGSVRVIPLLLALLALLTLSGLSHTAGAEEKSEASYTSLAELEHQRIGVLTGTVQGLITPFCRIPPPWSPAVLSVTLPPCRFSVPLL